MRATGPFEPFVRRKYLSLETFRKTGIGVRTPVWFAASAPEPGGADSHLLYVYTIGNTGKMKRIRNNPRVRIAPCDMRGNLRGDWAEAHAEILQGDEAVRGMRRLDQKYFPWKKLLDFFASFRRRERTVLAILPASAGSEP
ncbi:MAG: PPOX class F420-dependent oxidoreductase [Candidatus Acidiferrales bacterium]